MEDMKTASAETSLDVWVTCPYCDEYIQATESLKEHLEDDLTAEEIEIEVVCDNRHCKETFLVTEITY